MSTPLARQAKLLRADVWRYFDGLTDDELHWSPVEGAWGIDDQDLATGEMAAFTTIGWRIGHLVYGTWNWIPIIRGDAVPPEPALPHDAASLVALWGSVLDSFVALVDGLSEEQLDVEVDAWDGAVARSFLVSHVTLEIALHSAEVGTMRHLYREMHGDR